MTTANDKVIKKLNDLIELDHDAIDAYREAIDNLEDADARGHLEEFCGDHQRHTENLAEHVLRLGGQPAQGPDWMRVLTKGKVVIAELMGDHAILLAMRANEEVTNKRYELALKADGMDAATRATVEANLADERRHRDWISQQLDLDKAQKRTPKSRPDSPAMRP